MKVRLAAPRIDAGIRNELWFVSLHAVDQAAFFRQWLSCDELGVVEEEGFTVSLLAELHQRGLILEDGGYVLFRDYIQVQRYRGEDIPDMIYAFAECPIPYFKGYLKEKYGGLFTEERLDKYQRGVLVRDLGVPFSVWRELRRQVFRRDDYTCRYCGKHAEDPHCDHVIPLCKGGKTELDNLVTACPACNLSKHDKTLEEWRGPRNGKQE